MKKSKKDKKIECEEEIDWDEIERQEIEDDKEIEEMEREHKEHMERTMGELTKTMGGLMGGLIIMKDSLDNGDMDKLEDWAEQYDDETIEEEPIDDSLISTIEKQTNLDLNDIMRVLPSSIRKSTIFKIVRKILKF